MEATELSKTVKKEEQQPQKIINEKKGLDNKLSHYLIWMIPLLCLSLLSSSLLSRSPNTIDEKQCYQTCSIQIVESIPVNVTFHDGFLPHTTYYAWKRLIERTEDKLVIAAYKSSLQGKHVLEPKDYYFAEEGDAIFAQLLEKTKEGKMKLQMIESYPPKDIGDNADGLILQEMGLLDRRVLDISKVMGAGKMHSKFLLSDQKHFYMGSANLDWRSLNQKMELGFLVEDCSCLGDDLNTVYNSYWEMAKGGKNTKRAKYNKEKPLDINIDGERSQIYIASSPKPLNNIGRTWDLDAIVSEIDNSNQFLNIHVMDYHPIFVYRKPRAFWPVIDDALRRAITRGVNVKILSAGIHYPEIGIRFLNSLQDLNGIAKNGTVEVKIFKVPPSTLTSSIVINRDRRTHNKVMVTENAAIVGTSNWSGDYFEGGTTGTAIVVKQNGEKKTLINDLVSIFERNWESEYAHPVEDYLEGCVESRTASFCEPEKDPKLFATKQHN